jgi:hypothetical protein
MPVPVLIAKSGVFAEIDCILILICLSFFVLFCTLIYTRLPPN